MVRVSTYLNFMGNTEEAFDFYGSVFGTEVATPISRFSDLGGGGPPLSEAEEGLVMHAELPILAGHMLMGTDMLESMGHELRIGNNVTINLELDDREETDRLFAALSAGGSETMAPREMPWGAYWGVSLDRFGVRWMFNCAEQS